MQSSFNYYFLKHYAILLTKERFYRVFEFHTEKIIIFLGDSFIFNVSILTLRKITTLQQ